MTVTFALIFQIIAVVLFLLAGLLALAIDPFKIELVVGLLGLGLASHAAAHLPV
jgi:hypothetical protein